MSNNFRITFKFLKIYLALYFSIELIRQVNLITIQYAMAHLD